jgi:transcriptional regulator with XRE-family HTH domain
MQNTLSEVLAAVMDKTGLSQRGVARLGDFSEAQVGRWLKGQTQPDYKTIYKLATGIAREYPDHIDLIPALFTAAGYGVPEIRDERPPLVREHWNDPDVQRMWGLGVSEAQRLSFIEEMLRAKHRDIGNGDK